MQFSFVHTFQESEQKIFFAYTYPWSILDNDKYLERFFKEHGDRPDLYLHKELCINSPEGRKIEYITMTSTLHMKKTKEPQLLGLFPKEDRPYQFDDKKYIFISSRVHPGEVPASHMLNGILRYLSMQNPNDPRVKLLLDNFVFVIIPILNPDGVYRGHYRVNTYGQN